MEQPGGAQVSRQQERSVCKKKKNELKIKPKSSIVAKHSFCGVLFDILLIPLKLNPDQKRKSTVSTVGLDRAKRLQPAPLSVSGQRARGINVYTKCQMEHDKLYFDAMLDLDHHRTPLTTQ